MIYLLDADQNGSDSFKRLVDAGLVQYEPCGTFADFQRTVRRIMPNLGPSDLVVLDTIGSMADTTRMDAKLGTDHAEDLWDKRGKYLSGDKNYLTVYTLAGDLTVRLLKNMRNTGARIITTSHETEKTEDGTMLKLRAPALNDALYKVVMRATSDVFRLTEVIEPVLNEDGTVKLEAGTRLLQLRRDELVAAKYHVEPEHSGKVPKFIKVPPVGGILRLYEILQKRPTWLHIYGAPGVGKTVLSVSEAQM